MARDRQLPPRGYLLRRRCQLTTTKAIQLVTENGRDSSECDLVPAEQARLKQQALAIGVCADRYQSAMIVEEETAVLFRWLSWQEVDQRSGSRIRGSC